MKITRFLLLVLLTVCSLQGEAQKPNFSYRFYGQVRGDLFYNSRANAEIVDGLFHLYPKDRLPDANERVALRKTMESFCRDFHEIEERLSARGVILNSRLSMAPPEEAYAQIINLNDYELLEEYHSSMSKKKLTQATSQKHMKDE